MSTSPGGMPVRSPLRSSVVGVLEPEREQQQQHADLGGDLDEVELTSICDEAALAERRARRSGRAGPR